jgi:hypothetical protein
VKYNWTINWRRTSKISVIIIVSIKPQSLTVFLIQHLIRLDNKKTSGESFTQNSLPSRVSSSLERYLSNTTNSEKNSYKAFNVSCCSISLQWAIELWSSFFHPHQVSVSVQFYLLHFAKVKRKKSWRKFWLKVFQEVQRKKNQKNLIFWLRGFEKKRKKVSSHLTKFSQSRSEFKTASKVNIRTWHF